jgi:hypothetical protein
MGANLGQFVRRLHHGTLKVRVQHGDVRNVTARTT